MEYSAVYNTPIGKLGIVTDNDALSQIEFVANDTKLIRPKNPLAEKTIKQLDLYFISAKHQFDLPIALQGTQLQIKIWQAMLAIKPGTTQSYGALAMQIQTNPRVVGNACRANPIPIIVPCHRIVAANSLGGYAGHKDGEVFGKKIWLLEHEHAKI